MSWLKAEALKSARWVPISTSPLTSFVIFVNLLNLSVRNYKIEY